MIYTNVYRLGEFKHVSFELERTRGVSLDIVWVLFHSSLHRFEGVLDDSFHRCAFQSIVNLSFEVYKLVVQLGNRSEAQLLGVSAVWRGNDPHSCG